MLKTATAPMALTLKAGDKAEVLYMDETKRAWHPVK